MLGPDGSAPDDGEHAFVCQEVGCGKAFAMRSHLTQHHCLAHRRDWRFLCPFPGCCKAYMQRSHLNQHNSVAHRGERPFCCTEEGCEKAYTKLSHLKQHQSAAHRGERPFVCDEPGCAKSYTVRSHLTAHITTAHRRTPTSSAARRIDSSKSDHPLPAPSRGQPADYVSSCGGERGDCGTPVVLSASVVSTTEPAVAGWPMMGRAAAFALGSESRVLGHGGGSPPALYTPSSEDATGGAADARGHGRHGGHAPPPMLATAAHLGGWQAHGNESMHRCAPPQHVMLATYPPNAHYAGAGPRALPMLHPLGGAPGGGPPAAPLMMAAGAGGGSYYAPQVAYGHAMPPGYGNGYYGAPYPAYAPPPLPFGYASCYTMGGGGGGGGGGGYAPQRPPQQQPQAHYHAQYSGGCEPGGPWMQQGHRGAVGPMHAPAPAHMSHAPVEPAARGGPAPNGADDARCQPQAQHPQYAHAPWHAGQLPTHGGPANALRQPAHSRTHANAADARPPPELAPCGSGRGSSAACALTRCETDRDNRGATAGADPRGT
jgi:hypothetical protein